jgi:hypothetical protein
MKRPVLTAAAVLMPLIATTAVAQTTRDYAAIYGARGGPSVDLAPQQESPTTVGTGPAMRYAKPQPGAEPRTGPRPLPRGTGREFGYQDYGTVSGGYPTYGSREFPAQPEQAPAEEAPPAEAQAQQQAQEEQEAFAVSEGFFFDNYTSGTGFGVYGGEAVSSGPGSPLILPSAGNRAQELGFPTGPNNGGGRTPPTAPNPDPED